MKFVKILGTLFVCGRHLNTVAWIGNTLHTAPQLYTRSENKNRRDTHYR